MTYSLKTSLKGWALAAALVLAPSVLAAQTAAGGSPGDQPRRERREFAWGHRDLRRDHRDLRRDRRELRRDRWDLRHDRRHLRRHHRAG
jgi:hypothetical protein